MSTFFRQAKKVYYHATKACSEVFITLLSLHFPGNFRIAVVPSTVIEFQISVRFLNNLTDEIQVVIRESAEQNFEQT